METDRETKVKSNPKSAALLAADPMQFIALCWPEMRLYDKQQEVLLSVRDNLETFVHAANKMGKTRIAAIAAIWFFLSRTPARVVISSSNETQLESVLWSEIRQLIQSAAWPLPLLVTHLSIKKLRHADGFETESADYLLGHVTKTVESFQGHHLPNDKPRVLVIFDEASAIPDEFFEAAESWAHRKLVVGNPLSITNFFYRALPPCCPKLRQELSVLPLQYDSEGRMFLPPKEHNTAGPHQGSSLRQLLGRSPDRADSLVLAVWAFDRWRGAREYSDYDLICEDDSELTPEEIAAMPDDLREIYEMYDEPHCRYNRRDWRDDEW